MAERLQGAVGVGAGGADRGSRRQEAGGWRGRPEGGSGPTAGGPTGVGQRTVMAAVTRRAGTGVPCGTNSSIVAVSS